LAVVLIRAFARTSGKTVGNFWVDLSRCTLYVLLPLSIVAALILVWQGVPQNLGAYVDATTLEGAKQTLSQGPAASQIAIKQLGHQWRRLLERKLGGSVREPDPDQQFPAADLYPAHLGGAHPHLRAHGQGRAAWLGALCRHVGHLPRFGGLLVLGGRGNPNFAALGLDPANMEGKEVRFGIANSSLWEVATTAASNGSVNSMHDSFTPLGGMMALIMMQFGEIIYGGVGSGLYGMLLMVIVGVFVAGLMVGRTPEYLGKKIEAKEVKMAMLGILILLCRCSASPRSRWYSPSACRARPMRARTASAKRSICSLRAPQIMALPLPA
jgi:K+-transporting ATPase ATPase A chain